MKREREEKKTNETKRTSENHLFLQCFRNVDAFNALNPFALTLKWAIPLLLTTINYSTSHQIWSEQNRFSYFKMKIKMETEQKTVINIESDEFYTIAACWLLLLLDLAIIITNGEERKNNNKKIIIIAN